jgi:hypothetical protein
MKSAIDYSQRGRQVMAGCWKRAVQLLALAAIVVDGVQAQAPAFAGSVRTRAEAWRWFDASDAGAYTFVGVLARGAASLERSSLGGRIEFAAPLLFGLPDDAVNGAPQGQLGLGATYFAANNNETRAADLFVKQVFVRLGVVASAAGHGLRVGRFEFIDGTEAEPKQPTLASLKRDRVAHRLIGNFGWSHVQRSLDGAQYWFNGSGVNLTALATRPTQGVFTTDGWRNLAVNLGYAALSARPADQQEHDWRLFAVYYGDERTGPVPLKVDNRLAPQRQGDTEPVRITTIGAHYSRLVSVSGAEVDLLGWFAAQTGEWGLEDHRAYAFALEAGVQPKMPGRVWLRAAYQRSSGDSSSGDGQHETFFQILPTPRWYARFPFYNAMNVTDMSATLSFTPASKLLVRTELHRLTLTESADLWYSGGGAFDRNAFGYAGRPSGGASSLANIADLSATYRWSPTLAVTAYAGLAVNGDVIQRVYPEARNGRFAYLELEWRKP